MTTTHTPALRAKATSSRACLAFCIAAPEGCVRSTNIQKVGPSLKLQH